MAPMVIINNNFTQLAGVTLRLWIRIREVIGSNAIRDTGYPD
jgi:hypothetical protein